MGNSVMHNELVADITNDVQKVKRHPVLLLTLIFICAQALDALTTQIWFSKVGTQAELNGLAKWLMFIPGGPYVAKAVVVSFVLLVALMYFAKYPKLRRRALILLTCVAIFAPLTNAIQLMWFPS
jgi:hypothetical protein